MLPHITKGATTFLNIMEINLITILNRTNEKEIAKLHTHKKKKLHWWLTLNRAIISSVPNLFGEKNSHKHFSRH